MLDLNRVAPQVEKMARTQALSGRELPARLEAAMARWRTALKQPECFARLPRERNEPRLALPTHEPLDHCPPAPVPPRQFAVLAVDGSQIEPDFHEIAPCYLINVGYTLLRYGPDADGTCLAAEPYLFYAEAPDAPSSGVPGGRAPAADTAGAELAKLASGTGRLAPEDEARFGSWGDLDAQRMLAEALTLAAMMKEQAARVEPALAFLDGPLIAWRLDWITPAAAKQVATRNFLRSFEAAKSNGIPLAGYISRTRSTDLVNLLKYSACETAVATGSFCSACAVELSPPRAMRVSGSPGSGAGTEAGGRAPCYAAFGGLLDRQLLAMLLPQAGMRSPLFQSNSSVLSNLYGEHRRVGFFYLNTGGEISRVEVPQWVWGDPEQLAQVHALVYDQVTLGRGYPIALSEAHEQAVVRASERTLFFDMVRRAYGRYDVAAEISAKALRKRGPIA